MYKYKWMTLNDHKKIITGVGSQNVDISKQKSAQRTKAQKHLQNETS